jgi:hypothetical protein
MENEHNSHEYTVCPDCLDTVLDINMLYDENNQILHCTNCAHESLNTCPGTIPDSDRTFGSCTYSIQEEYEPSPYDGTYSEM